MVLLSASLFQLCCSCSSARSGKGGDADDILMCMCILYIPILMCMSSKGGQNLSADSGIALALGWAWLLLRSWVRNTEVECRFCMQITDLIPDAPRSCWGKNPLWSLEDPLPCNARWTNGLMHWDAASTINEIVGLAYTS